MLNKIIGIDEKAVFFKLLPNGEHNVSNDYRIVGISKYGSLIVEKNYVSQHNLQPIRYNKQHKSYIKKEFLNTVSEYWQESKNKPKYFVRIMPNDF